MSHKNSDDYTSKSAAQHSLLSMDPHGGHAYPCKKVIIFGYKSVGKSSLLSRYLFNHFPETNVPDFTDNNSRKFVTYHNMKYELEVIDSPTFNEYMLLVPQRHQYNISGYAFVFAKDDFNSFKMISLIREKLFKMNGYHKPCIIIENKFDLEKKKVKSSYARTYADMHGLALAQISAKTSTNEEIAAVFDKLLTEIDREEYKTKFFKDKFELRFMDDQKKYNIIKLNAILNAIKIVMGLNYIALGIVIISFIMRINLIQFIFIISGIFCTASSILNFLGSYKKKKKFFTISAVLDTIIIFVKLISFYFISILSKEDSLGDDDNKQDPSNVDDQDILNIKIAAYILNIISLVFDVLILLLNRLIFRIVKFFKAQKELSMFSKDEKLSSYYQ